jgi:hypothetical protein
MASENTEQKNKKPAPGVPSAGFAADESRLVKG